MVTVNIVIFDEVTTDTSLAFREYAPYEFLTC